MNNQNAVATLLQDCKRALDALLSSKADTGEEDEREYQRCQGEVPKRGSRTTAGATSPQPCPIFLLLADECQEMPGFQGHEWDVGYRQAGKEVHFVAVNCCQF